MLVPREDSTSVHHFGICSLQTLTDSTVQYILHDTQNTIFSFTANVEDAQFNVQVTFKPFQRSSCSFTYHDYELRCLVPSDVTESSFRQSKKSVVTITQEIYDRHFLRDAGYRFKFLKEELRVSFGERQQRVRQPKRSSKALSKGSENLVWIPPTIPIEEPPSKRQKCFPTNVTIEEVQKAYEDARRRGRLMSPGMPRSTPEIVSIARWDPYYIPAKSLYRSLLDEEKLSNLHSEIHKIIRKVPLAAQWTSKTQAKGLTPADLRTIVQTALGTIAGQPRLLVDVNVSPILAIGSSFLNHADQLELQQKKTLPRATSLARLLGFSVMRVYETVEQDSNRIDEEMQRWYSGHAYWQKQSRQLACYWNWMMAQLPAWKGREVALYLLLTEDGGEQTLRQLFKPSLPASVGELAMILNSTIYSESFSTSSIMPSSIEIVKCVLDSYADDTSICRALGCPDSYLDGSAINWLEILEAGQSNVLTRCLGPIQKPSVSNSSAKCLRANEEPLCTDSGSICVADEASPQDRMREQTCEVLEASLDGVQAPVSRNVQAYQPHVDTTFPVTTSPATMLATRDDITTTTTGFDDTWDGEGILQDLDHFPYDFNISSQIHDLDSLDNDFRLQF